MQARGNKVRASQVAIIVTCMLGFLGTAGADDIKLSGRLCLASLPAEYERTATTPSGKLHRVPYAVKVDGAEPIALTRESARWVPSLALDESHVVVILSGSKRVASFAFRFPSDGTTELCLFLSPFYATWQLWPDDRCPWCKCENTL